MKLEQHLRRVSRSHGHALNTEKSYVAWYKDYVRFHNLRHPGEMGEEEVEQFLTYLAADRNVAVSTQKSALCALAFLYEHVLDQKLRENMIFKRASKPRKLPVVLTPAETKRLLRSFSGLALLQAELMYGCGLRISDCLRLRVKDIDFDGNCVRIHQASRSAHIKAQLRHAHVARRV